MIDKLNNNTFRQTLRFLRRRDSVFPKEELCCSKKSLRFLKRRTSFLLKMISISQKRDSVFSKENLGLPQREPSFQSNKGSDLQLCTSLPDTRQTRMTVTSLAPCAPMTNACSISAVFEGPEMNVPNSYGCLSNFQ